MVIIIYIYQTSMITHYSYSLPKVIAKQYSTKASNSNERQNGAGAVRFRSQRYSFFLITTTTNYIQSQNHQSHDNNFKAAKLYTDRRRTRGGLGSDGSSFDGGEIHNGLDPVLGASELRSHGCRSRAVEVEVEWREADSGSGSGGSVVEVVREGPSLKRKRGVCFNRVR